MPTPRREAAISCRREAWSPLDRPLRKQTGGLALHKRVEASLAGRGALLDGERERGPKTGPNYPAKARPLPIPLTSSHTTLHSTYAFRLSSFCASAPHISHVTCVYTHLSMLEGLYSTRWLIRAWAPPRSAPRSGFVNEIASQPEIAISSHPPTHVRSYVSKLPRWQQGMVAGVRRCSAWGGGARSRERRPINVGSRQGEVNAPWIHSVHPNVMPSLSSLSQTLMELYAQYTFRTNHT